MKSKILMASIISISLFACTSKQEAEEAAKNSPSPVEAAAEQPEVHGTEVKEIALTNPLNQEWVANGEKIYDSKCLSCHKLTDEKVVGQQLVRDPGRLTGLLADLSGHQIASGRIYSYDLDKKAMEPASGWIKA